MKFLIRPKFFFKTLRFIGDMIAIWPKHIGAKKTMIMFHEVKWWLSFTNATGLLIPLVLGVYYFRNDSITMTKTLSELTALCEVFINLIQCRLQEKKFQVILYEIENFIENSNEQEESLLQDYLNRYKTLQLFVGSSFISTAILFSCIPIFTSQLLPADAWYPFSVEYFPIRVFLYITQVLAIFQTGFGICVDLTVATMLWYSAVQIELLEKKVRKAVSKSELRECARRHQEIIEFTDDIKKGIKFIILKTNATMIIVVICGAFQLIHHEPLEVLLRFTLMVLTGCLRLYVSAKPADDLKENSEQLARTAFQTALMQKSTFNSKIGLMLAFRCQKPIVLSVTAVIRAYTLQYYASFLSRTVTYFVNLRAVLDD
ncbi:hypothetical protein TSAR_001522 [Trichomalopsis sarcophagae]|uniref:Odorant receptor n=1 Tax=Trichomalopsis sarcophagae TaxID=543379 RepID=A0A232EVM6_9HYME|nr:hypothetical protein TSAR_001522 [Trichomalopsis sarcophagae]